MARYPILEAFATRYLESEGARTDVDAYELVIETSRACTFGGKGEDFVLDDMEEDLRQVIDAEGGQVEKFIDTVIGEGDILAAGGTSMSDQFIGEMAMLSMGDQSDTFSG